MNMNREILRIALPNIISNITVPIMGIVSTMIAGHLGDSVTTIGALAIGVSIFNFIYWNCSFIRMGTSGITAQAFGASDNHTTTLMLARAVVVSVAVGFTMLLFQKPLGLVALKIMNGGEMVADYFFARIWAVPAGVLLFGLNGWLTGMQNAVIPMIVAIVVNIIHIACSLWFAFPLGMGIVGIAYASVVAQWTGVAITAAITWWHYGNRLERITWREVMDMQAMRAFFVINR
ncbi:MAG: MATE family efflux transporter, partial [Alistipes sp.]|nr:MATE family efflux transporter [Alistipes sp.]